MVILPINKRLKKKLHRTIALAQDILIMEIYDKFPSAIVHGGTAIWRCYGSNRFSEDVDFYFPPNLKRSDFSGFLNGLKEKGFKVEKFRRTNNSVFAKFSYLNVTVRCEIVFKRVRNFITKSFEMSDGTSILVNTLTAEDLIEEKALAYIKRRKVRDLYDVFFLLKFIKKDEKVKRILKKLVREFKKPVDEKELKVLIISGSVPKVDYMLETVRRWVR